MSKKLIEFNYGLINIRTIDRDGEIWFVAADVCSALEIINPTRSLKRLDDDEKGLHSMKTLGGKQDVTIISESGLYSLILTSRKTQAKLFKRWVTHDVLPAIRKTGSYTAPKQQDLSLKEHRAILSRITNLTSKMAKIKDAMEHKQTWLEITVLCDTIGLSYPAIEFMRKHFKQVEKLGVDAPDMYAKLADDTPKQLAYDDDACANESIV